MGSSAEETIFVTVGKNVERNRATLFWALDNFPHKRICLLHVHKPARSAALNDGSLAAYKLKENGIQVRQKDIEMQKMHQLFSQYQILLADTRVEADMTWIEMDDIGEGIVASISSHDIRWLVMGAASNKHYSKNMSALKSRKAMFVCQNAPEFSHIWFTCKGCLIYTRNVRNLNKTKEVIDRELKNGNNLEEENAPLLHLATSLRTETREHDGEACKHERLSIQRSRSGNFDYNLNLPVLPWRMKRRSLTWDTVDTGKSEFQGILNQRYQCSEDPSSNFKLRLTVYTEQTPRSKFDNSYRLEQAQTDVENSRKKEFVEAIKRWKEEDNACHAKQNEKLLEISCAKESNERKELETELRMIRQELEDMRNQHTEVTKQLHSVQEQKSILENEISESNFMVRELEEKILSAVELLITFKERRDKLRAEYEHALQVVRELRKSVIMKSPSFCSAVIFSFTFEEIMDATHSFDQSYKIGEGDCGTMYKGVLRHVDVAIKMLPSSFFQGVLDFQNEVEILSRVRHPNLIALIGTCPESYTLIYEYVKNGNLQDRLTCRGNKTPTLPWQTRMLITAEICSTLIFLHSHEPPIIHGNIKPSNILLDPNFVSKISDLGITRLAAKQASRPDSTSIHKDPEYFQMGELTRGSDVHNFGVILLQLISGRSDSSVLKDMKHAIEKGNFDMLLDASAGDWPLDEVEQLALMATRCCESKNIERPNLASEIWTIVELMRDLAMASASRLRVKENHQAPSHFVCPIYQEVMKDPLIAADGFTYEAEAIRGWLESGHNTSPMTNLKLMHTDLVPNYALLYAIQEWRQLL
ncbi:hypothetical protein SAY86_010576 [Trapa natans]|uniref:RING-type E3 ubiquitin transferase n=1 Tax=Trapa natans TaxID=22666 RepID=A0AAN7LTS4_TRANT|nr:hypothetical protein SAY86_010576 [Trapa natans]